MSEAMQMLIARGVILILIIIVFFHVSKLNIGDVIKILFQEIGGLREKKFSQSGTINISGVILASLIPIGKFLLDKATSVLAFFMATENQRNQSQFSPSMIFYFSAFIAVFTLASVWFVKTTEPRSD